MTQTGDVPSADLTAKKTALREVVIGDWPNANCGVDSIRNSSVADISYIDTSDKHFRQLFGLFYFTIFDSLSIIIVPTFNYYFPF